MALLVTFFMLKEIRDVVVKEYIWEKARLNANKFGMYLATITCEGENSFLVYQLFGKKLSL